MNEFTLNNLGEEREQKIIDLYGTKGINQPSTYIQAVCKILFAEFGVTYIRVMHNGKSVFKPL
jgi:hypothetical protein